MTVVVAVESHERPTGVALAWDGGVFSDADGSTDIIGPKGALFSCDNGRFGVAMAGSERTWQVLRYHWEAPDLPVRGRVEAWAVTELVPSLQELAKEHGIDAWDESLWAVRGAAFYLGDDWSVMMARRGYTAAGAASGPAMAALAALEGFVPDAYERAEAAVVGCIRHSTQASEPRGALWVPG